jgi:ABC-type sugar transport system ATPase subunit
MSLLEVNGIGRKEAGNYIVKNISFTQSHLQKFAIAGATGSGKTTLFKMIAGLIEPTEGVILFNGEKLKGPNEKLIAGHPQIAYLSQHFELRNHYHVEEILEMATRVSPIESAAIYEVCRITHLLKRWTHQLSGGEKQRIALARLLVTSPKLLLLDEPFSNLDPFHKNTLKNVIDDLSEKLNITCILVSHDPLDTLSWADEILILQNGKLIQRGRPEEVYKYPVNEYAAGLFGKYNLLNGDLASSLNMDSNNRYIRPEDFLVVRKGEGVPVEIIQVNFMGSFYEIEIKLNEQRLIISTKESGYSPGNIVYVALNCNNI